MKEPKRVAHQVAGGRNVRRKVSNNCKKYVRSRCCPNGDKCKYNHPESPLVLPDEMLLELLNHLGLTDICNLAQVCHRFRFICKTNIRRWHTLFVEKWGPPTQLEWRAAALAGGWQELYKAKITMDRSSMPWKRPSTFEIDALGQLIADLAFEGNTATSMTETLSYWLRSPPAGSNWGASSMTDAQAPWPLTVMFLLDGSGSLSEMDFDVMRTFVKRTVTVVKARVPQAKVGMLQFTTEVRVEIAPTSEAAEAVGQKVDGMTRMNGGTNLAAPILLSEQLLRAEQRAVAAQTGQEEAGSEGRHVLVLLSDGIVEPHHACAAAEKAAQLGILLPNVTIYALGVGRDVDVSSMKQIIGESYASPANNLNQEGVGGTSSPANSAASTSTATPKSPISPSSSKTGFAPSTPPQDTVSPLAARLQEEKDLTYMQRTAPVTRYLGLSTLPPRTNNAWL
eukprot:CAMPEP_0118929340 /NCGR_PEP_ID=MMETSP1169-20130426/6369_1 /TAXON_ID=36882 /ORGANISM="Pyramimonas obovata, Strain CCMP722" /LENGTH=451 /DNA_ID=CAMNT_0006871511 /DNA_START=121 /DNA_END=1476 /DNA_ORIENTATION=-